MKVKAIVKLNITKLPAKQIRYDYDKKTTGKVIEVA